MEDVKSRLYSVSQSTSRGRILVVLKETLSLWARKKTRECIFESFFHQSPGWEEGNIRLAFNQELVEGREVSKPSKSAKLSVDKEGCVDRSTTIPDGLHEQYNISGMVYWVSN
jgi:hypothetical protein